ncbi:hypothetical protein LNL84_12435 [Vibrio sp. ZSDZ34]|uniref:Uncharacterized protein n=1 Tax=Vibrio gelatinilyticus TaxID=2893468 RepID=A0A9X1WJ34_9VIBR|nr:hypothetical protein [Vibrio gelatinilyticus]MCJ2377639.1 hypothetical protein [Vibrio gelatinilyticus]
MSVYGEYLKDDRLDRTVGADTHIYAHAHLNHSQLEQGIDLVIEAGKAGEVWDRRIELYFDEYVVAIGFGTLGHPPYVWIMSDEQVEMKTFEVEDSGYSMHFNDILSALGFERKAVLTEVESGALMSKAMNIIRDIYFELGTDLEVREQNLHEAEVHRARYLTEQQLEVRTRLKSI